MAKVVQKKIKGVRKQAVSQKPRTGLKSHAKFQKKTVRKVNKKGSSKLDEEIKNLKKMIAELKEDLAKSPQPSKDSRNQEMSKKIKCLKEDYKKLVTATNNRLEQIEKLKRDDDKLSEVIRRKQDDTRNYSNRNKDYERLMKDWDNEKNNLQKKCEEKHQHLIREINKIRDLSCKEVNEWKNHLRKIDHFKSRVQAQEKPIKSLMELKISVEEELQDVQIRKVAENVNMALERKIEAAVDLARKEAGGFRCD